MADVNTLDLEELTQGKRGKGVSHLEGEECSRMRVVRKGPGVFRKPPIGQDG